MDKYTALIILNYNNYLDTINCVKSIMKFNTALIKFIIVDNASTQKVAVPSLHEFFSQLYLDDYMMIEYGERIDESLPRLLFIVNKENMGYARGNNVGIEYAYKDPSIDKLIILNNDILFTSDIIGALREAYNSLVNPACVTPLLYKSDNKSIDYGCARLNHTNNGILITLLLFDKAWFGIKKRIAQSRYLLLNEPDLLTRDVVKIEVPVGAFMMIDKELMYNLGCFDPHTFLYYEENILFKKISKIGKQNYLIPSVSCIHIGAASTSTNTPRINSPSLQSLDYYVRHYSNMNYLQLFIFTILYSLNSFVHRFIGRV